MCRVDDDGSLATWMCSKCEGEATEKRKEMARLVSRNTTFFSSMQDGSLSNNIPKRFLNKTLENYVADNDRKERVLSFCKAYLKNFAKVSDDGVSICLCGKPGTGKTHLAYAIVQSLRKQFVTAVVRTAADMTAEIKSGFKSDDREITPETIAARYASYGLLVIDEVGIQVSSEAEKRIFFDVMNKRYEGMRPTIMISNLEKDELTSFVGERVMDRMKEGGGMVFAFDWESYR